VTIHYFKDHLHLISGHASKKLSLKAQFLVDGQTNDGLTFVDETIRIPHFEDCLYAHEGEAVGKITLGENVIISLVSISPTFYARLFHTKLFRKILCT
jgi:hypothetical protein